MNTAPRLIGLTLFLAAFLHGEAAGFVVDRIDPPHWWTGMTNPSLQLQVHGKNIRGAVPSIDYQGVKIDSVVNLDGNSDWQHIYLTISPETKPGKMRIEWKDGKRTTSREYTLRARKLINRGARGFDASDVLYMIMPDRFADGNPDNNYVKELKEPYIVDRSAQGARHGGDLAGIRNHIDYIDSLGVTAVWLNPVLENDMKGGSYHGYATTDYYRTDPRFGSNEEYKTLISELHNRGIKTVMDMIFNHSGSSHPWLESLPSGDWVNFPGEYVETNHKLSSVTDPYSSDFDKKKATEGWFVREMPDLNQLNPHLMKYLIQNSIWWIEEAEIDAIRMDTYPYADRERMGEWVKAVKAEYPEFEIVGECWFADPALVSAWQSGSPLSVKEGDSGLDVVMDFPLMLKMKGLKPLMEETNGWMGLNEIYSHLALDFIYADPLKVLRFLDNHDTDRVLLSEPDSLSQWKQAMTLLLTVPGIPQIYYGTELLMNGTREGGDGNVRKDMPGGFPGDDRDAFTSAGRTQLENEAYDFLSQLLQWRKGSKAIAEGTMKHYATDNGLYVYQRSAPEETVTVIINGRDSETTADMSRYYEILPKGAQMRDILSGREIVIPEGEDMNMTFSPRDVMVLVRSGK